MTTLVSRAWAEAVLYRLGAEALITKGIRSMRPRSQATGAEVLAELDRLERKAAE